MNILVSSYYDEFALAIMQRVCTVLGGRVSDWFVAYPSQNPAITYERYAPGAIVHDLLNASRGIAPNPVDPRKWPAIDQSLFERMQPYERAFFDMLTFYDPTGNEFTDRERQATYRALLQFGMYVIGERRPDLYVSFTVPHSLHAYVLYALCRVHGIPTLIQVAFALPGYLYFQPSVEEANPALLAEYAARLTRDDGSEITLPAGVQAYYDNVRSTYAQAKPWYSKLRDEGLLQDGSGHALPRLLRGAGGLVLKALRNVNAGLRFSAKMLLAPTRTWHDWAIAPMGDFFKQRGISLQESKTTQRDYNRLRQLFSRRLQVLLDNYRDLEQMPDLEAPFIFVPLHYQPEVSTCPLGGYFADQIAMVELLSKCLPGGWRLYVKEHKSIFDPSLRGSFCRDADYYRRLVKIRNVTLVPMSFTSFDLIDRSKAVASVTGTGCWEAVLRGRPSIIFGNAWYRGCEGVFEGQNEPQLREAMDRIVAGFVPDQRKIRHYLAAVVEVCVYADRDNTYKLTELTPEQSEMALADTLVRDFRRFFPV